MFLLGVPLKWAGAVYMSLLFAFGLPLLALAQGEVGQEMGQTNAIENWQLVLAFILPLIVSFIIKQAWDQSVKAIVAFIVAAIATTFGTWLSGGLTFGPDFDVVTNVLKVFALTIPFYYGFWQPTGVTRAIHSTKG